MNRSLFLILLVLGVSGPAILQARSLPEGQSHRFVRRRISPDDPDLEIIEVKEVYYVRRPKKVVIPLDEDELDRRIRCDFEPSLVECRDLIKKPVAPTRPPTTTTTTTTTEAPTTSTTTTPRTTTTTTQEPLRDESMERSIRFTEEIVEEPSPDDDIALAEDDGEGNDYEDPKDQEDDLEDMYDANPNPGETHSIGAHDDGSWNF
ncbi:hypothetical protein KR084_009034 [Drosophila pseudotakahashii]|nr:hypothetical protein KR084_009034 [Drosophila pseudotakahashii]